MQERTRRVLIVEDEPLVRTLCVRFCGQYRKDLELVAPASLAELEAVATTDDVFDIVFADSELKEWRPGLLFYEHATFPAVLGRLIAGSLVVSTSGRSDVGHELCARATALGVHCQYLGKPFNSNAMEALLRAV